MTEATETNAVSQDRVLVGPLLWTGFYGAITGLLIFVALAPPQAIAVLRLCAIAAFAAIYVATARGVFTRWMGPAAQVVVGSPASQALGGPGRPTWTPANIAYLSVYILGVAVVFLMVPLPPHLSDDGTIAGIGAFLGVLGVLYGLARQPRQVG